MIGLAPGTKVFLACRPVDLRNGFDGLAAKAQQVIGADPFSGHLFIFLFGAAERHFSVPAQPSLFRAAALYGCLNCGHRVPWRLSHHDIGPGL